MMQASKGSSSIVYNYDALNRLTNMVDAVGTSPFVYKPFGGLESEDGPWSSDTVTYSYNNARLRSALSLAQLTMMALSN